MKFVQEKEMLESTVDRRDLSTSLESEASQTRMVEKTKGKPITQPTDEVDS